MDETTKKFLGKKYLGPDNKEKTFKGFKKIIEDYKNAYKSYDDIVSEQIGLKNSPNYVSKNNDNIYYRINVGYNNIIAQAKIISLFFMVIRIC